MPQDHPSPLFGGFSINRIRITPADGELWRDGEQIGSLRPKAMDVLVALAERPNEVVTRDELMRLVWSDRVISEDTLTTYLSEIRRALGDDARSQSILQTVAKRGYRLRGEISVDAKATTHTPPSRRRTLLLASATVSSIAALWLLLGLGNPPVEGSLVVAGLSHDPDASPAVVTAAERYSLTLRDRLNDLNGIRVSRAKAGLTPGELAAQQDAYVLWGSIRADSALDDRLSLNVTVTHLNRLGFPVETPLGQFEIPMAESAYFAEMPRIRDEIVERIKTRFDNLAAGDRGGLRTTTEPEAYRLYLLAGELQINAPACGESGRALLERALEIDPSFADGWNLLGYTHWTAMWSGCGNGREAAVQAVSAADMALKLDPTYHSAHYLKTNVLVQTGQYEVALAAIQKALREQQPSPYLYASLSVALRYAGLVDEAANAARQAIAMDSQVYLASLFEAPLALLYAQDIDGFVAQMPEIGDSMTDFYAGYSMLSRNSPDRAKTLLDSTAERRGGEQGTFADLANALQFILNNQPADAIDVLNRHIQSRDERGAVDGEITFKQAQLFALASDSRRAIERMETAVEEGFLCIDCATRDVALSKLVNEPAFQALARRVEQQQRGVRVVVEGDLEEIER